MGSPKREARKAAARKNPRKPDPYMRLAPYQQRYVLDTNRRKVVVKSRRIGFTFGIAYADALRACGIQIKPGGVWDYDPRRGVNQILVSASKRQSKLFLAYCVRHIRAFEVILGEPLFAGKPGFEVVRLRNGAELKALAPNPDTIRSETGDVTLDELQSIPRAYTVWAAVQSVADKTLGNADPFVINCCGTPLGDDNLFYDLVHKPIGQSFSKHIVDIHTAAREGFPIDPEAKRVEVGDPDLFGQEYECQFLSASGRYISSELYDACTYNYEFDGLPSNGLRVGYAGLDVGRKSDGDPSALVLLSKVGDVLWHTATESRRGESWGAQEAWITDALRRCERLALDATGIGSGLAEAAVTKHGSRVEPIEFTLKSKEMLATGLKLRMERGRLRLRDDDPDLRRDLLSLRRTVTKSGNVTYDAARTKEGHADRAWALAMAVHTAGSGAGAAQAPETVTDGFKGNELSGW